MPLKNRKKAKSPTAAPIPAIKAISKGDSVFVKSKRISMPSAAVDVETKSMPAIRGPIIIKWPRLKKILLNKSNRDKIIASKMLNRKNVRFLYL